MVEMGVLVLGLVILRLWWALGCMSGVGEMVIRKCGTTRLVVHIAVLCIYYCAAGEGVL